MKKRILSIFAVLAVAVNMVGCAPSDLSAPVEAAEQVVEETELSETKQALTFDEVNRIEINGVEVSLPFKIEDLGEGYSIGEVQGFNEKVPALFYGKQCLALIEQDSDTNIVSITFDLQNAESVLIEINNLSFNNTFSEIIEKMGIPTKQKELALIYEYDNGKIYFGSANGDLGFDYLNISLSKGTENEQ